VLAFATLDVAHGTSRGSAAHDLAFNGATIDGGVFTTVTDWARTAPTWVDDVVKYWSAYGMVVFAVLLVAGWWTARRQPPLTMARVLVAPAAIVLAYGFNLLFKSLVEEVRPCRQLPSTFHVETCAAANDWAFPSNHTVVAFAAATTLWMADRRLGRIAVLAAVAMGFSRVYVGAHYPHDVLAGALVGIAAGAFLTYFGARLITPAVERSRPAHRRKAALTS